MEKTSGRLIATTIVVAYGTAHLFGGVDVPTKPISMLIQATSVAGSSNNAITVSDTMSTRVDKSFSVTPPVDNRRPGRPTDRA
jgi:hypothetical protein